MPSLSGTLVGSEQVSGGPRKAAVAAAQTLLDQLPLRLSAGDSFLLPAFERVPAEGSHSSCVDRVVALPFFGDELPTILPDGTSWLQWIAVAALTSGVYALAAHAVNRALSYRPTIPKTALDQIFAASTRLRSGAREARLIAPSFAPIPTASSGKSFAVAMAESRAADAFLRRKLLEVPDDDPQAELMHAYADRIQPCVADEIPAAFKERGALPLFSNPDLFLAPFAVRVQPPRTGRMPPVQSQPAPPSDFKPGDVRDLLSNRGQRIVTDFYENMYEWMLAVDEYAPLLQRNRRDFFAQLVKIAAGDTAALEAVLGRLGGDLSNAAHREFISLAASKLTSEPRMGFDVLPAPARSLSLDRWEQWAHLDSHYKGPSDEEILAHLLALRPEPVALGQSCMVPEARGIVWDLRGERPEPLDFSRPISTHLNLDYLRELSRLYPTYPDQELFDHLIGGVRFKIGTVEQTVLQPHLSSLPKGFVNVHKELLRLVGKGFFKCFENLPFLPWRTLPMGVAFRKLEPDRPRRTTDGGSPRRGSRPSTSKSEIGGDYITSAGGQWLVDTDGHRVVPLNVATRWPAGDLERGTLEVFFLAWKERLKERPGSPPPFHPLLAHADGRTRGQPDSRPPSPRVNPARRATIIFAGKPEPDFDLGVCLRSHGWVVDEYDTLRGGQAQDVTVEAVEAEILNLISASEVQLVWLAPPCKPYSVAADDRPQLFSVGQPFGKEPVPQEWSRYVAKAALLSRFVARVVEACHQAGIHWVVENPPRRDLKGVLGYWERFADYGTLWHALKELVPESIARFEVTFPYCALGAPYQKVTTLWTSYRELALGFGGLVCTHERHAKRLRGKVNGVSLTEEAAEYPVGMILRAVDFFNRLPSPSAGGVRAEEASSGTSGSSARHQLTVSSIPAAPALRVGTVIDIDITRAGPTPHFANPFKLGQTGSDGRLRSLAVTTYRAWLEARTVRAGDWPTALPISRKLMSLTGEQVEGHLSTIFRRHGNSCRFHFVCGARCFGKMCHGLALVDLAAQILDSSDDPPFPKEVKCTVPEAMADLAILLHLSHATGLPVYQICTDVSDFFNQHRLHPSSEPHVGLITLELEILVERAGQLRRESPKICNVAEGVLGYGLFPASEICQRHAYFLTFVWLVEMERAARSTVLALCRLYPVLARWRDERRKALEPPADASDRTASIRFGQSNLWSR